MSAVLCGTIVLITGYVIGWRAPEGLTGLAVSDPESAQAVGLIILFPIAFISSCFVPTQGLPSWMRVIADWNPVSAVAASCRELLGNPNPAKLANNFPAHHPVGMALGWSIAIIVI